MLNKPLTVQISHFPIHIFTSQTPLSHFTYSQRAQRKNRILTNKGRQGPRQVRTRRASYKPSKIASKVTTHPPNKNPIDMQKDAMRAKRAEEVNKNKIRNLSQKSEFLK